MTLRKLKRVIVCFASAGMVLYGLGGCGLREIGAGLLSEFLTSGGISTLNSELGSGLSSLLSQLTGTTTTTS